MTSGSHSLPSLPADISTILRRIVDAPDIQGLADVLHDTITHALPEVRVDLFVLDESAERLLITCGKQDLPAPPAVRCVSAFIAWLQQHGYQTDMVPLTVADQLQ